jgi:phage gp36-like protein
VSHATPANFLARYDARVVGDLVDDTGNQREASELQTNPVLQAMLDDASGTINAALLVGGRYTVADLQGLTGDAKNFLIRICCDIAKAYLLRRRPTRDAEADKAEMELAERHLEQLRSGDAVFGLIADVDAGKPLVTGPSTVDFSNMNLIRDRTRNYYPRRVLPDNR